MNNKKPYRTTVFTLFQHGFVEAKKHWRVLGMIYFVQLSLSIVVGMAMYSLLSNHMGHSVEVDKLSDGFRRSVFMDMIYSNEGMLDPIFSMVGIIMLIYVMLILILKGGYLTNIRSGDIGIKAMMMNGIKNYLPFLGYALISVVMVVISALIIVLPAQKIIGDPLVTFYSEKPFVWSVIGISVVVLILWMFVYAFSLLCKYDYVSNRSFIGGLRHGFVGIKNNFFKIFGVMISLIGIHVAIGFLYYILMCDRGASSWWIVLVSILIQQVFAMVRVYIGGVGVALFDRYL